MSTPKVTEKKKKRVKPPGAGAKKGATYRMLPPMLRDARWAYRHVGDQLKGTEQQEKFRQVFRESPQKFLDMLGALERQHAPLLKLLAERPSGNPPAPAGAEKAEAPAEAKDEQTGDVVRLLERWLAAWQQPGAGPPEPSSTG